MRRLAMLDAGLGERKSHGAAEHSVSGPHGVAQPAEGGTLYVVATPVGNLRDITLRALDVLGSADVVAAEDTRTTRGLLEHYGLRTELVSIHEHNERRGAERIVTALAAGRSVAYVTDAGTPGISDPGAELVAAVRAAGLPVVPVPGPSALTAALSVAGPGTEPFLFVGFLPPKPGERRRALERLAAGAHAVVVYESPHRIEACAADLAAALGASRTVVIARELTKRFETVHATTLGDLPDWLASDPDQRRGEFVLVIGAPPAVAAAVDMAEAARVLAILGAELPPSRAARATAAITGASREALYAMALAGRDDAP